MLIFKSAFTLIILGVVCALHLLSQLTSGILAKSLAFVNIALHIGLLFVLMLEEIPIAEAVLAYMFSTFVYVLIFFVMHSLSLHREQREEDENDL